MSSKVLLVEDDTEFLKYLSTLLRQEGFVVSRAEDADEAMLSATQSPPDLILSDVKLKGIDGITLCRQCKADKRTANIPVILLTGSEKESEDQIRGLESGADDYLLKPISGRLLIAKIKVVLHRYTSAEELQDLLKVEDLTLDVKAWTVTIKGKPVYLTRKEFDLLLTFLKKRGRVLNPSFLLEHVWGYDPATYDDARTVKVHISSLRTKLGPRFGEKIINVPGVGYKFDA
jgi:two-component system response regulator RegX3